MMNKYEILCHLFDEYFEEKYGIHGMILSFISWKNLKTAVYKTFTYYDFCKEVVIKLWGIENSDELYKVCNEFENYGFDSRVVYSQNGYYPGNYYEKQVG